MELLVTLLGELIFAPFLAALASLVQLLVLGFELLLETVFGRRRKSKVDRDQPARPAPADPDHQADPALPPGRGRPLWLAWAQRVLIGTTAATVLAFFVVGTFFVPAAVGWMAGRIESRTGIEIEYRDVGGNLFFGDLEFDGLHIRREGHEISDFDVAMTRFAVDMNLWSALWAEVSIHEVKAVGVRGRYTRIAKPDSMKPRRDFEIGRLLIEDLELEIADRTTDRGELTADISIRTARCEPMRSRYALFDALFRSDVEGGIAGRDVHIASKQIDGGRATEWRANDLPLDLAAQWIGGPFAWIVSGVLDVEVADRWQSGDTVSIDSHWRLTLRNIEAEVPEGLGMVKGAAARAVVAWLNRRDEPLVIPFDLTIHEHEFRDSASTEVFLDLVANAFRTTLAKVRGG